MLLFIDNIFRFSRRATSLGAARPHAERRRLPADAGDRDGPAAGAHHLDRIVGLNKIVNDYRHLLLDLQKVRFDLGLDEYKRGFPTVTASAASVTASDRATTDEQVLDALATLDEILAGRRSQG